MNFIRNWANAMPNTIAGLCVVAIIGITLGTIGLFTATATLSIAAMLFGQVGTVVALVGGFILDRKRIDRG